MSKSKSSTGSTGGTKGSTKTPASKTAKPKLSAELKAKLEASSDGDPTPKQLQAMNVEQLRAKLAELTGATVEEQNALTNKKDLIKRINEAVKQSKAEWKQEAIDQREPVVVAPAEPVAPAPVPAKPKEPSAADVAKALGKKRIKEAETPKAAKPKRESDGLMDMDVEALQKLYAEVVGRTTGSDHKGYLVWKIREARKGRIKVGPRQGRSASGVPMKVIPLRIETEVLGALEGVIGVLDLGSRNNLFREALREYLTNHQHPELAAKLGGEAAPVAAE